MVNLNSFKVLLPIATLGLGKYFSNIKSGESAVNFHNAARAQIEKAAELQSNSIANQTYWSPQIAKLLNSGPSVTDTKVMVDLVTAGAVSASAHYLGMNVVRAATPAYVLAPVTAAMAYLEHARGAGFHNVIKGLYNPDCAPESLQLKLAAASKIGSGKSPEEYGQLMATLSNVQDLATFVELAVSGGALWSAYEAHKVVTEAAAKAATEAVGSSAGGYNPAAFAFAVGADAAAASSPPVAAAAAAASDAAAAASRLGSLASTVSEFGSKVVASAGHAKDVGVGYASSAISSGGNAIKGAVTSVGDKVSITMREAAFYVSGAGSMVIATNLIPIASTVKSSANSTLSAASDGIHSGANSVIGALNSERADTMAEFLIARESFRQEVMKGFLKTQFAICSVQEGKSYAGFLDTYTDGDCGENTLSNLLTGQCRYVDPLAASEL